MIKEYAIDPELVAAWARDPKDYRYFMESFGFAQGRFVANFPKSWIRSIHDSLNSSKEQDKLRLTELVQHFKTLAIKRNGASAEATKWFDNAKKEHLRFPFGAILVKESQQDSPGVLDEKALEDSKDVEWKVPSGLKIRRHPHEMAYAVKSMLSLCRWAKFVDPFLCKCGSDHKKSMSAFFEILFANRPVGSLERVEIHSSGHNRHKSANLSQIESFFGKIVPVGEEINVFIWREREGGAKLHNRYILTNLGGVLFGHGLDAGDGENDDDLNRLDHNQYLENDRKYNALSHAFTLKTDSPILVKGTRSI